MSTLLPLKFTWNPVSGIDLGFITIHFYSLMFVVAFSLGFLLMKPIFKREGIAQEKLDSLFIYAVVSILLGARLGHVIFYQSELFIDDPLSVFLPFSFVPEFEFTGFRGLASHGAAIVTIIGMYIYNKKILKKGWIWILDRVVIPVSLGAVFVRIGNFLNSEMVGKETENAIGVKFIQHQFTKNEAIAKTGIKNVNKAYRELTTNPDYSSLIENLPYRYPGQLMEAFGYIFVFLILLVLYWKTDARKKPGLLFGTFLLLLMTVRFIVEQFKLPQVVERGDWDFNTGQVLSIPFILVGLYFVITSFTKKPKHEVV